jgi:hypothetical protein
MTVARLSFTLETWNAVGLGLVLMGAVLGILTQFVDRLQPLGWAGATLVAGAGWILLYLLEPG